MDATLDARSKSSDGQSTLLRPWKAAPNSRTTLRVRDTSIEKAIKGLTEASGQPKARTGIFRETKRQQFCIYLRL